MNPVVRALRQFLFAATLACAAAAHATESNARWACWYQSSDLSIQCLLARAEITDARRAEIDRRFDSRLPELVRTIWANPQDLAGARIAIPLGTDPYDMQFVAELARSVMCGARRDCSIGFDANADGRADIRAAAIEAGVSEQEVMAEVEAQGFRLAAATTEEPTRKQRRRRPQFG